MQIYTKFRGISRNSVTFYTNFSTIQHSRHFLHTAEKLQDADWGGGGGKTVHPSTPTPHRSRPEVSGGGGGGEILLVTSGFD